MKRQLSTLLVLIAATLGVASCNRAGVPLAEASSNAAMNDAAFGSVATVPPQPAPIVLPAGTSVSIRLLEALDTQRNRTGDRFTASLDEPLVAGDRVIVAKGTRFDGHITLAQESGRFKGRAQMALTLDSFESQGRTYPLQSTNSARFSAGHKKHNWLWMGGGTGGGAAIGAIAGGGTGALIGAGAGTVAGVTGAAITGKRQVRLPVETRVTFTLRSPINVGG